MNQPTNISQKLLHTLLRQQLASVNRLIGEIRLLGVLWILTEVFDRIAEVILYLYPP